MHGIVHSHSRRNHECASLVDTFPSEYVTVRVDGNYDLAHNHDNNKCSMNVGSEPPIAIVVGTNLWRQ